MKLHPQLTMAFICPNVTNTPDLLHITLIKDVRTCRHDKNKIPPLKSRDLIPRYPVLRGSEATLI